MSCCFIPLEYLRKYAVFSLIFYEKSKDTFFLLVEKNSDFWNSAYVLSFTIVNALLSAYIHGKIPYQI
jgi:hypothetical protein